MLQPARNIDFILFYGSIYIIAAYLHISTKVKKTLQEIGRANANYFRTDMHDTMPDARD